MNFVKTIVAPSGLSEVNIAGSWPAHLGAELLDLKLEIHLLALIVS